MAFPPSAAPHPPWPDLLISCNSFPCHTSENLPVSPAIATDPKTHVSNPCVCHTSDPPGALSTSKASTFQSSMLRSASMPSTFSPFALCTSSPAPISFISNHFRTLSCPEQTRGVRGPTSISFVFRLFRTLLRSQKSQLLCIQSFPHSLPKTPGVGGIRCLFPYVLASSLPPSVPLRPGPRGATMSNYQDTSPLPPVSKQGERTPGLADVSALLGLRSCLGMQGDSQQLLRVGKAGSVRLG
jgi:hypothetical protein